ncbi:MAG: hypothetical protein WCO18_02560, partial [bacterium]
IEKKVKDFKWKINQKQKFFWLKKDLNFINAEGEQSTDHKESLIVLLDIEGLDELLKDISLVANLKIEGSFPHVTLFVKNSSDGKGIGFESEGSFNEMWHRELLDRSKKVSTIIIPTRIQNDTLASIFLLKNFGEALFPNIDRSEIKIVSQVSESAEVLLSKGTLLIDIGGGIFDHHRVTDKKVTTTGIIADYLGIEDNPAFDMWFALVERCEFFGKGIISSDPIDKAFGLPGLLVNLNNLYNNEPNTVYKILEPIINAHVEEQKKRTVDIPKIFQEKIDKGEVILFSVKQHGRKVKIAMLESDDSTMSGYLRSRNGGNYQVVVLHLSSGHVNIITKGVAKVDLTALAAILRKSEALISGKEITNDVKVLSQHGRMSEVPEWYYDPATNSIQNGGINPTGVKPTKISWVDMKRIVEAGLSGQI